MLDEIDWSLHVELMESGLCCLPNFCKTGITTPQKTLSRSHADCFYLYHIPRVIALGKQDALIHIEYPGMYVLMGGHGETWTHWE